MKKYCFLETKGQTDGKIITLIEIDDTDDEICKKKQFPEGVHFGNLKAFC